LTVGTTKPAGATAALPVGLLGDRLKPFIMDTLFRHDFIPQSFLNGNLELHSLDQNPNEECDDQPQANSHNHGDGWVVCQHPQYTGKDG
jgi:hypothetical protein